jgi:hypothetical protein
MLNDLGRKTIQIHLTDCVCLVKLLSDIILLLCQVGLFEKASEVGEIHAEPMQVNYDFEQVFSLNLSFNS